MSAPTEDAIVVPTGDGGLLSLPLYSRHGSHLAVTGAAGGFGVTHVASGRLVATLRTLREARTLAEALAPRPEWGLPPSELSLHSMNRNSDLVRALDAAVANVLRRVTSLRRDH